MKKINFNYLFIIFTLFSCITGLIKEYIVFTSIIFIHELGHIISSMYFKWNIESINVNIYGCNIKFNELINRPMYQELIISVSGIIMQSFFFLLIYILFVTNIINSNAFYMIKNYHYSILLFNLIPIYPLDGYKILNLIINTILPYKKSHKISIYISFCLLPIVFFICNINNYSSNTLLIVGLLTLKLIDEAKNSNLLFNKFLLERYLYSIEFSNKKRIRFNIENMYRDYTHVFCYKNKEIAEKKVLKNHFRN